ncbi:MAG: hypothetical protein EZS28_008464 [Streblomastix strix]|uniref:Uncharacterized protein n=1 Tax=Streblomastix strix TaxID=222440 RepID=A0A5J4WMX2_9EUKA|nr:MAG: hypothetical protein EZS28_008464 [Streblomastix strix]
MVNTGMNKDKPGSQTQPPDTPTKRMTHRAGVKQRQKKLERELQQLQASQQLEQQENNDLNNTNVEKPDIQGTVGQLTGLQPSSGAQSPSLNARERTDPQINEGQRDNAEEEKDKQTDEAALIQNKDYIAQVISYPPVQENLCTQPQNDQGLNALSQMEKDNSGPAPVGVQQKFKNGKGSRKSKAEGLSASNEQNQGSNVEAQTKTTSKVPITQCCAQKRQEKTQISQQKTG